MRWGGGGGGKFLGGGGGVGKWGGGGGLNFVCVLGALKNRCGMEYRTKGLINEPGWLALQRSWYLG